MMFIILKYIVLVFLGLSVHKAVESEQSLLWGTKPDTIVEYRYVDLSSEDPVFQVSVGGTFKGTGFCFYSDRNYSLIMTAAHVVNFRYYHTFYLDQKEDPDTLELVFVDKEADVAVLKSSIPNLPHFKTFASVDELAEGNVNIKGDPVWIWGYTYIGVDNITESTVIKRRIKKCPRDGSSYSTINTIGNMMIRGAAYNGCSGSPILDKDKRVVGLLRGGLSGYINFGVTADQIVELLNENHIKYNGFIN